MLNTDLENQIKKRRVAKIYNQNSYFISLSLASTLKLNRKERNIHYLFSSVYCNYPKNSVSSEYLLFDKAKDQIINERPGFVIVKKDFKKVFYHILLAKPYLWLIDCLLDEKILFHQYSSFAQINSLYLFDLLMKGFNWMIEIRL